MEKQDLTALTFTGQALFTKTYNWYKYRQNNSGGSFHIDDDVSIYVLIQATSTDEADIKAQEIGIYFNGCQDDYDCDCCGDRWYGADWPMEEFSVYYWKERGSKVFNNVRDYAQAVADEDIWAKYKKPSVIVYYADGSKELFYKKG